jgi:hypothetical protein
MVLRGRGGGWRAVLNEMCRKIDWSVSGVMEPKDKRETFPVFGAILADLIRIFLYLHSSEICANIYTEKILFFSCVYN